MGRSISIHEATDEASVHGDRKGGTLTLRPDDMPLLRPRSIPTAHRSSWSRLLLWATARRRLEVMHDWRYTLADGIKVVIPAGFVFDGALIPKPLWIFESQTNLFFLPALLHDFIYDHDFLDEISGRRRLLSRRNADAIFRDESIHLNGIPRSPGRHGRRCGWSAFSPGAPGRNIVTASFQVERRVQNPFLAPDLKM